MSPIRVLRGFVFGAMGGVLGWVLVEFLFQPARFERPGMNVTVSPGEVGLQGAALGLAIGGCLGISEGLAEGTMSRFRRAFFTFLLLGAIGGYMGFYFGQYLFGTLGGKVDPSQWTTGEFFPQLLIRSLSWMLIGPFIGVMFGVPNLSVKRMWNGAVGGAIGGLLGGFVFAALSAIRVFYGPQLRFLGFLIMGTCIGFFISLVAEALKQVWVKVLIGRNEGREHVIDTPVAYIGRDELADVPVFLDSAVPRRMARLQLTAGRYTLHPESQGLQLLVNGQPIPPNGQVLRDGDAIQFGRVTLAYFEKATATGGVRAVDSVPLADFGAHAVLPGTSPIPTARNVCEFCGQQRDPVTGACACTVPAGAPGPAPGGFAPGYDPGMGGYGAAPASQPMADYGAPPGGVPMPDLGYVPTMQEGGFGSYPGQDMGTGPRFIGVSGPYEGQVIPLTEMEAGIGRDPSQQIALVQDSTASRRHARIMYVNGQWILRDEGSSNGTWVNGVRIQEQPLMPGDTLRIGGSQFQFQV